MPVQWALHPHSRRHCFTTPIGSILAPTVDIQKISLVVFDDHEMERHSSFFVLSCHAPQTSSYFISSSPLLCAITSLLQKRDMYVERESHVNIITQIIFFSPCHFLHWTLAQLPTPSHSIYMEATTTIASRKHTYCSYSTHEWTRGIFASAGTIASQSSLTILNDQANYMPTWEDK